MSVVLINKSGEIEGENLNTMATGNKSKYGWRTRPVWWAGVTAVCLGLVLLIVIIGFTAHNTNATGHLNSLKLDLMRFEKQVSNLTKDNDELRDEQDQLKINSSRLTEEMEALKSRYDALAVNQDHLLQEVKRLNHSTADKICQPGWVKFYKKCYYASVKGQSKTWEDSRRDCLQRKADMVIINSGEELDFVTRIYSRTWIGLSDAQQEGRWKWVDGSDLQGQGFWQDGEPNSAGDEDCVNISSSNGKWNDLACNAKLPWICED